MAEEEIEKRFFWTEEDIKKLPVLPEPVETFDLETDEGIKVRVRKWERIYLLKANSDKS